MAIASSLFSPKSLMDRFRSPVFIASALSLGAHGVFFAAMPMLSASEDLQDQEESVPVVALSPEEAQRLPDAVRNSDSSAFWGDNPFVTQDGESLLPVPGIPPYGDLTGLTGGFDDPLPMAAPLWDSPIDIFQGSLPAIPGETSVIFPDNSSLGAGPVALFPGGGIQFDNSNVAPSSPAPIVDAGAGGETREQADEAIAPEDQPIINGANEVPGSGLEAPLVASGEGTTMDNVFGGEADSSQPVDADQLAQETPGTETPPNASGQGPGSSQSQPAGNDPALIALQAEQQRLREGYRNNGAGAANPGQVAADLGQLGSDQAVALQRKQTLVVQYPDPTFKCPADSLPALFSLVATQDGTVLEPQLLQSSQYAALDTAAQTAVEAFAAELTAPGVYPLTVTFQDETGRCASGDAIS